MTRLKTVAFALLTATAIFSAGCEDSSKSVLDKDEGVIEETREGIDRKVNDAED